MKLPRFLDRVLDATTPLLAGLDRDLVTTKLEGSSVALHASTLAGREPDRAGFLFAANLAARLYPRIALYGPEELLHAAEGEIVLINPRSEVLREDFPATASLGFQMEPNGLVDISVAASGWDIFLDSEVPEGLDSPAAPAALFAAALGMGELFRAVFAEELSGRGRRGPQPGAMNLITLGEPEPSLNIPAAPELGEFRLVGLGAIGQAAAHTLACSGASGTMFSVDPERIELSNLQRYVLSRDSDIGKPKVVLLEERLRSSAIDVVPLNTEWHAELVSTQIPTLTALDSAEARIGVQASLPGPIYNAWTQPADIGFSRHEEFGEAACLACLYWPEQELPSRHEQIAAAFNQHPLRILGYLIRQLPVGLPLPPSGIPQIPGVDLPSNSASWLTTPLIDDIAGSVDADQLVAWRDRLLGDLYQEGICGGALLHLGIGEAPREVLVPLAHQSALAGVMLGVQLIAALAPELRAARPGQGEGRYDVLAGLPQQLVRPRQPTAHCLCGDSVFRRVYRSKVKAEVDSPGGQRKQPEGVE
jgi:hypothetical protein